MSPVPAGRVSAYLQCSDSPAVHAIFEEVSLPSGFVDLLVVADSGIWVLADSGEQSLRAQPSGRGGDCAESAVDSDWAFRVSVMREQVAAALGARLDDVHVMIVDGRRPIDSCDIDLSRDGAQFLRIHATSLTRVTSLMSRSVSTGASFSVPSALDSALSLDCESRWVSWNVDEPGDPFHVDDAALGGGVSSGSGRPMWWNGTPVEGLTENRSVTLIGSEGMMSGWVTTGSPYEHQGWWLVDVKPAGDVTAPAACWPASCLTLAD